MRTGNTAVPASGFTLAELLIAVAIVAILTVVALPSFSEQIERYRLRTASDDLISVLASARLGAVKLNRDVAVAFRGADASWCIGANAAPAPVDGQRGGPAQPCDCAAAAGECLVDERTLSLSSAGFRGVSLAATPNVFRLDGKLGTKNPLAPQQAVLASATGRYRIAVTITALGEASTCVPADGAPISGIRAC